MIRIWIGRTILWFVRSAMFDEQRRAALKYQGAANCGGLASGMIDHTFGRQRYGSNPQAEIYKNAAGQIQNAAMLADEVERRAVQQSPYGP